MIQLLSIPLAHFLYHHMRYLVRKTKKIYPQRGPQFKNRKTYSIKRINEGRKYATIYQPACGSAEQNEACMAQAVFEQTYKPPVQIIVEVQKIIKFQNKFSPSQINKIFLNATPTADIIVQNGNSVRRLELLIFIIVWKGLKLMNFLNGQGMVQQPTTIGAMQAYITELTLYINENNEKYTRNLQTLKQFYEDQINNLNDTVGQQEEQILHKNNEIITLKDLLLNRNTEIQHMRRKIQELKIEIEQLSDKVKQQREKNQQVYVDMDRLRETMQASIDKQVQKLRALSEDRSKLLIQVKEKEAQIRMNQSQIKGLEQKVAERYTLPQRMKDMQIQTAKDRTNISNLEQKLIQMTKQRDYSQTELEKKRKQNEKLTIQANKSKGDLSFQIQQAARKQKETMMGEIDNLKIENERKIFQIKELQIKLKQKSQLCAKMENAFSKANEDNRKYQSQIKQLMDDKSIYLNQFRKLKTEYEEVISNLQGAIPQYQKKNWILQQQNQDLNTQLNSLQQLLREVRAMNDMEPARKQYRQWAQLNLAADKKLPEQQPQRQRVQHKSYLVRQQTNISPDWEKLMSEIERIQI